MESYGSIITPPESFEGATCSEYNVKCDNESQFVPIISSESPNAAEEVLFNNITNEPFGVLEHERSNLYQRRIHSKSNNFAKCGSSDGVIEGMERRVDGSGSGVKRVRNGTPKTSEKSKKVKVDSEMDSKNEGQNGFAHLNEFLSNIQYLNDGTLNFDLDVGYDHFKLKVEYSFE